MMYLSENKILDHNFTSMQSIAGSEEYNENSYNEFQDLSNCGKSSQSFEVNDKHVPNENLQIVDENPDCLINNSDLVDFRTDIFGNWTYLSSNWKSLSGYSIEESIGRNSIQFTFNNDRENYLEKFRSLINNEIQSFSIELRLVTKSGIFLDVEINENVFFDNQDHLIGTRGTIKEISYQSQNILRNEKQKINILLCAIKDLFLIIDNDAIIRDCNVSENNSSLLNPDLLLNKSVSDIFHDIIAKEFIHNIKSALKNKELIKYQYHIESGSIIRYFEATLSKITDNRVLAGIRGIDNPYETDNKLKNINSLHTLIHDISSDMIKSKLSNFERIIKLSLTQLGIFTQVDRVSIYKFNNDHNIFENSYQWCAIDISPNTDKIEVNSYNIFPEWIENLRNKRYVYIPSVDLIEPEHSKEKPILSKRGIKSFLAVPMNYNGVLIGFIAFYSIKTHKFWDDDAISLLKVAGDIFAGSIKRSEFELEIIKHKNQAEQDNIAKSEFVANVCRELKLPMQSILNLSEIMVCSNLEDESLKVSALIYKNSKRLGKLLNDISKLSQIDSGKIEINKAPVYVKALLSEVQQVFSNKLSEKKLVFNVELHEGFPDKIIFDSEILRTILFNLVGNAIKFTAWGRVDIIADVTYGLGNGIVDICFTVKDTGIGIEPEYKNLIFDSFSRIDNKVNRKRKGLGLGLTITKRLVNLLDGSISVESNQGSGSTFTVEFKKVKVVKEDLNTNGNENNNYFYEFDHSRILVFDEIKQSRELMKSYLSDFNFSIIEAVNEQEIVHYLNQLKFDLIFINLQSTTNDIYQTIENIKTTKLFKDIPIVAISTEPVISDVSHIFDIIESSIDKPINNKKILDCLSKYLPHNKISTKTELNDNDVNVLVAKNLVDSIDKQILAKFIHEFELIHKEKIQEIVDYFDKVPINNIIHDFNNFAIDHGIEAFSDLSQQIINATENLDYDSINDSANTIMKSIAYCKQIL